MVNYVCAKIVLDSTKLKVQNENFPGEHAPRSPYFATCFAHRYIPAPPLGKKLTTAVLYFFSHKVQNHPKKSGWFLHISHLIWMTVILVLKTDFCGKEVQDWLWEFFFTCGGQQYNTSVYHKYTYKPWLRILASFCVQKFHTCLWHYANSVRWLLVPLHVYSHIHTCCWLLKP